MSLRFIFLFSYILFTVSCSSVTIISSSSQGGSISPSGVLQTEQGTTLLFKLEPNPNYKLEFLLVNGEPLTSNVSLNTFAYSFSNPFPHTVTSIFKPLEPRKPLADKFVGILYETWFTAFNRAGPLPVYPQEVPTDTYRYWGIPALGRYKSDDENVINQHADMLSSAGVDFLVLDYSNNNILDPSLNNPVFTLLRVYANRVSRKIPVPRITFLIPADQNQLSILRSTIYNPYSGLFFEYEGRPLLLPTSACNGGQCNDWTCRTMWGLLPSGNNEWSFLQLYPQKVSIAGGIVEEVPVSAAQQETYMSLPSAHGRTFNYRTGSNNGYDGINFDDQWNWAIEKNARFVIIKSWNEWVSLRLPNGQYTDQFDPIFSSDVEPVQGNFGDLYYQKLKQNIARFK